MTYAIAIPDGQGGSKLKYKSIKKITNGLTFQAAHKGILRLHRVMSKGHEVLGDWCKRIHTDSFAIDPSLPVTTEDSFFSYLEGEGLQVQVKASGSSHFLSLNEGIIGKKAVGSKREVLQSFRDKGIRIKQQPLTEELDERWGERLEDSPEDEPTESRQSSEATQLELLTTAYPVMTPHALQG